MGAGGITNSGGCSHVYSLDWIIEKSEKGQQLPRVKPRTPLAWATSALPLNYGNQTTTNPQNPLYVLYRWYWMSQSHTWQPLSMCRQNSVRCRLESSLYQERTMLSGFSHCKCSEHFTSCWKEMSFQQAICYLSFRWVNKLYAWTVNSVNRLVKNPKHITAITFFASSQECLLICIMNARLLACDRDGWRLRLVEKVVATMCFGFLNQSVHSPCMQYVHSCTCNSCR